MTLIVEDGTGLATSNSYGTVAEGDAYFADFPTRSTTWAAKTVAEREEALILATQYIDSTYSGKWIGVKRIIDQALAWPRNDADTRDGFTLPNDAVPAKLKKATFEAAYLSAPVGTLVLLPQIDTPASGIKRTKDKVDVVETEIEYFGSGADQQPKLTPVDGLLQDLISGRRIGATRIRG